MSTAVQFRGGTTAQHDGFVGKPREVTVDTDKHTLVVHDGVTPGGHPLMVGGELAQTTGQDTNRAMSQKAVTEALGTAAGMPLGAVIWWVGTRSSVPPGYIPLDGQLVARSAYPDFRDMLDADAFPTVLEAGWAGQPGMFVKDVDGTHFRVPNMNTMLNGLFARGDGGSHSGNTGADTFRAHDHGGNTGSAGSHGHSGTTGFAGAHTHNYHQGQALDNPSVVQPEMWRIGFGQNLRATNNQSGGILSAGSHQHAFSTNVAGSHQHSIAMEGGGETAPAHIRGVWCLRVAGAIGTLGDVDVDELVSDYNQFLNAPNFPNMPKVGGDDIVESGMAGATDFWARYSSGFQICAVGFQLDNNLTQDGIVNFPKAFAQNPFVTATPFAGYATFIVCSGISAGSVSLRAYDPGGAYSPNNTLGSLIAVGRWK